MTTPPFDLDELLCIDRQTLWHPFTQMAEYEPLLIERATGCRLFDVEGREYVDGVSSLWCNLHGHRHPRIDAALREQLDKVAHTTALGASNSTTIRLAKRLTEIAPPGLNHVYFSDNGSTAVEVAVKLALQYWRQRPDPKPEKTLYAAFDLAYHGDTLGSVAVGGVPRFHAMFKPLLYDVLRLPVPDTFRLPRGIDGSQAAAYYLEVVERALATHGLRLAALIIEPLVQAAAGMVMHPPGFLRGVRELCTKYGVLLIADEVAVGFGRTGQMFACEHEGVSPDLLCLAKGLTAGYLPMAATLSSDEIYSAFLGGYAESKTFFHGHTYCGNPLAAAAALASLAVFVEERTLERLPVKIERLAAHLRDVADLPLVGDVRQLGLMAAVELVADKQSKAALPWQERHGQRVCQLARQHGVLLRPLGDVIVIMPPLAVSLDEIDQIMAAVSFGIRELGEGR